MTPDRLSFKSAGAVRQAPANQEPASPALDRAYTQFLLTVMDNRPRPLQADNSPAALEHRTCDLSAQILACKAWLTAIVEDTAQHLPLSKRLDDVVETYMADLMGDALGPMLDALEEVRSHDDERAHGWAAP